MKIKRNIIKRKIFTIKIKDIFVRIIYNSLKIKSLIKINNPDNEKECKYYILYIPFEYNYKYLIIESEFT